MTRQLLLSLLAPEQVEQLDEFITVGKRLAAAEYLQTNAGIDLKEVIDLLVSRAAELGVPWT